MFYIYLDTNFLSQFAKVARNVPQKLDNKDKWLSVLNLLRRGVERNLLLCPASQFPIEEAMLAKGLFQELVSIQIGLSKGWFFKDWEDILVHQVANQALKYLGRQHDIDLGWKVFTRTLPSIRDSLTTAKTKLEVAQYAEFVKPLREKYGYRVTYNKHYKAEKVAFLKETFLNSRSGFPDKLINEARIQESEVPKLYSFMNPDSVECIPFINIFCSLWTSIIFSEKTRRSKEGDLIDVVSVSCAILYC